MRRHAAVLSLMLALAGAVSVHHAAPAMSDAHHGSDMVVMAVCLGVFAAVSTAIVAVALGLIALGRWQPVSMLAPAGVSRSTRPPEPRARAGPALLVLLCVSRR